MVSAADPGASRLASSIHESGDAPDAAGALTAPAVGAGSEPLLGGLVFLSLFLPGALPLFLAPPRARRRQAP
jgi:hypothetical protein